MDEAQYPKGIKLAIIMTSLLLGTSLVALDATIISVATPQISTEFRSLGDVGWYGAAYSMVLTATTPIAANFYKYFNPKSIYLAFIVIFEGTYIAAKLPRLIMPKWVLSSAHQHQTLMPLSPAVKSQVLVLPASSKALSAS